MSEVYSRQPEDAEPLARGRLIDGTPCTVIESYDSALSKRKHGYDAGLWTHDLCLCDKTGRFIISSTQTWTGARMEVFALVALDWKKQVPQDGTPKGV